MHLLTVKEVAELKGCSKQYILNLIAGNRIQYEIKMNKSNRQQYLIPLTELSPVLQRKWYKKQGLPVPSDLSKAAAPLREPKPLESYTEDQRRQIGWWIGVLDEWQSFRAEHNPLSDADTAFLAKLYDRERLKISAGTLYRKWAAYKLDDLDGLIDKRGQWRKGETNIHPDVWRIFLSYYLDQARFSVPKCIRHTGEYLRHKGNEALADTIPPRDSFYRQIGKDIPAAVKAYQRKGSKAVHDRYAPYISRMYDGMMSNDYWVGDNHTFDFISLGEDGRPHRLYLTAFLDARSLAFVGWKITYTPCGDATLAALKHGILRNGLPTYLYVDNGSEFLVHDIGGRGHRKKKKDVEEIEPPTVLRRLGITMINAIPGNPEAKVIERVFRDVKDELSRSVKGFCGGTPDERPERLAAMVKALDLPTDQELIEQINTFIEGYFNHLPYNGAVKKDHGKPRIQVYNENIMELRRPKSEEDLHLLMMRSSRPVKVGRKGVRFGIAGYNINYWTEEFCLGWQDKRVYYRYDPDDLSSVRVYSYPEDVYITTLPADDVLAYNATSDEIKKGMRRISKYNKLVREWTDGRILAQKEKISAYDLMQMTARQNIENPPEYMEHNPKVISLIQSEEPAIVSGTGTDGPGVVIDLQRMIRNRERQE